MTKLYALLLFSHFLFRKTLNPFALLQPFINDKNSVIRKVFDKSIFSLGAPYGKICGRFIIMYRSLAARILF